MDHKDEDKTMIIVLDQHNKEKELKEKELMEKKLQVLKLKNEIQSIEQLIRKGEISAKLTCPTAKVFSIQCNVFLRHTL